MEAFSGMQNVERGDMAIFISYFVQGLRSELKTGIERNVVCWQSKPLDELLRYANYYSDEEEARKRQLKEKHMIAQTKLAQGTYTKIQGVTQQSVTNANGAARGRGVNASKSETAGMSIAELKKIKPCHGCGELGHRLRECPHNADLAVPENDFSDVEISQEDLIPFSLNRNVRTQNQVVQQNQVVRAGPPRGWRSVAPPLLPAQQGRKHKMVIA